MRLASISLASASSYDLTNNSIRIRLLGLVPIKTIHLTDVHYLRLATKDEMTTAYLLFNWLKLLSRRRTPIYVLQTKGRRRIFLRLDSCAHFKLRQAIGKTLQKRSKIAA